MFTTNSSIKYWAEDDRPREKMLLKGKEALSDVELIAILIGSGTKTKSAVDLAQLLLSASNHSLYELGKRTIPELKELKGVGDAKAVTIAAALELGRRRKGEPRKKITKLSSASDAYDLLRGHYEDLDYEEFRIIGLSKSNNVIGVELISRGGRSGTVADGKIIFKKLLDMKASACILSHNHPSGTLRPSDMDLKLTRELLAFGRCIDLQILDHIIITDNGYYSFADEGVLSE